MAIIMFLDLEMLVKTASTLMILLFIFVNLSVIIMRESRIQNYRPKFKSPLYPWIQVMGIVLYILLLIDMGKIPLTITGIFLLCGLAWFWFYGRINSNRQSAIVHIIKRITSKELLRFDLDDELKEIVFERDEIIKDRFDEIIEQAVIKDIKGNIEREQLFEIISENMCSDLGMTRKDFYDKLCEREKESTMLLTSNLAIPHLIIDGSKKFKMMLIRAKDGIKYNEEIENVDTVFVIAGTRDQRTFHLKALAAIAQIVNNENFHDRWMNARNLKALRDVILLGTRKRVN